MNTNLNIFAESLGIDTKDMDARSVLILATKMVKDLSKDNSFLFYVRSKNNRNVTRTITMHAGTEHVARELFAISYPEYSIVSVLEPVYVE